MNWYVFVSDRDRTKVLEILGIEVLLYLKSAKVKMYVQYIIIFQELERFRVLLMDVSQAIHSQIGNAGKINFAMLCGAVWHGPQEIFSLFEAVARFAIYIFMSFFLYMRFYYLALSISLSLYDSLLYLLI